MPLRVNTNMPAINVRRQLNINNRDLKTLRIDLATSERLAPRVPPDRRGCPGGRFVPGSCHDWSRWNQCSSSRSPSRAARSSGA